jgi:TRAP-type transport system small permease protein
MSSQPDANRPRIVRGLATLHRRASDGVDALAFLFSVLAGLVLFGLMLMIVVDISGRYLFNRPLSGTIGISEILMAAAVFLGLAQTQLRGGNIRVEILTTRMPPTLRRVADFINYVAVAALAYFLLRAAIPSAIRSRSVGEVRYGVVDVPVWPGRAAIAIGAFALLLVALRILLSSASYRTDDWSDR